MLIVFEGPDGAGKTSIAEGVQRKLSATRTHCGPPHPSHAFEHWMSIVRLASNSTHAIVCDRLHWGDKVYAEKYRPEIGAQLSEVEFDCINSNIHTLGGIIVYVHADAETLRERFDGEYIDPDDIDRLLSAYNERLYRSLTHSHVNIFEIDTTNNFAERYDILVDGIVNVAKREHSKKWGQ